MSLTSAVKEIEDQFFVSDEYLDKLVDFFVGEADKGLAKDITRGVPMIPVFVTNIPNGSEKGLYLAADLGGSNFRVCSVHLNGDSTHDMKQMKWEVPQSYMKGSADDFWKFLADCTSKFLDKYHSDKSKSIARDPPDRLRMGFTFSFPVHQTGINRGKLIRWTKGYDIEDAVGTDVCAELQKAMDARELPVYVAALVNDTVGCLLARSFETGSKSQTLIGCILGTGTNAAYSEKITSIKKLETYASEVEMPKDANIMLINTEWGSFDNDLKILPNTEFDKAINLATPNPDFHMFEKRVSGMFLGEIVRRVIERLVVDGVLFQNSEPVPQNAALYIPWSTDTGFLSLMAEDTTPDLLSVTRQLEEIGVIESTVEERQAVKEICHFVAIRSARLVAGIIAGLLKMTKAFDKFEIVDIGMDGAVIEFYPHFEELIRETLRSIEFIGPEKEKRITIGISKDGSGIGGALCAAMAH